MCGSRSRGGISCEPVVLFFFFFNDTATTEIYTLSLHDALPIFALPRGCLLKVAGWSMVGSVLHLEPWRSEEHTSELQSLAYLVCRLLLEKKNARQALLVKAKELTRLRDELSQECRAIRCRPVFG